MSSGRAGPEGPPTAVLARFQAARVAVLATLGPAGPRAVPITFAWCGGRLVWAVDDVKPKQGRTLRRLRDLRSDPRVAVLVQHYAEAWSRLWWIELQGVAAELAEPDRAPALAALAARYPAYRDAPPPGPVVAVTPLQWAWWSAGGAGGR